ncbi:MAG: hypothetical protein DHS20C01_19180 [marine bacterium B5-7]|nr:MAG: hypothetical protein DHS20C01_19180 [marine bacterium B5-7]
MVEQRSKALEQTRRLLEAQHQQASDDDKVWRALAIEARDVPLVIPINNVVELAVCENITPIPLTQTWIRGLTNLRGQLYTVIDLSVFFGGHETRLSRDARIVLLSDDGFNTCLLVNSVLGLKVFGEDQPLGDVANVSTDIKPFFRGQIDEGERQWAVLDVDALITDKRFLTPGRLEAVPGLEH